MKGLKIMLGYAPICALLLCGRTSLAANEAEIRDAYHRSYAFEKIQDYGKAIDALLLVHGAYPYGYTVNLRLGWLYYLNGNYANAIYCYGTAMKAKPSSAEAKLGCMLPLMTQGKYAEVEALAYQILGNDAGNYYANLRLARALRMQRKDDLAGRVVARVLALYPTDVSFLTELGLIRQGQGNEDGARAIFLEVLILDPENPTALKWLQSHKEGGT